MCDAEDLRAVRALLEHRRYELIERYDAAGVGIGREGGDYVIVVYLKSEERRPPEEVALEGVQMKFTVTGPFTIKR